ncbi:alpha/beta hydrolase [Brevundimonas sp. LM2]|uniref:alpha/beta hydrolase n=1 Tax=Brevundimonas sp. LM2 TaxID=1938605 RepID=UPI000983DA0C|nr:alpha/beta hydrolase [Brevundimonas sp. LM2]AQR62450.1 alpha/beta hydrolase [Brevundimonas sp. LM2]
MSLDRRTLLGVAALASAGPALSPATGAAQTPQIAPADPTEVIRLWPAGAPGGDGVTVTPIVPERSTDPAFHDRYAEYTTDPILTVMRPARPNGAALLLIPGGGYRWAVVDKEGMDVARVFAAAGVTCFVLRYRLPADGWAAGPNAPLQDAQRALRLIRAGAADYGIDPARIASLGASAGGHLAGLLAARRDATYDRVDAADAISFRPDLNVLLYPVVTLADPFAHVGSRTHLLGAEATPEQIATWSLERMDWSGVAPTVLIHALDDASVPVENSLVLLTRLRAAAVTTEAHLFQEGGHGFGTRLIAGKPAEVWPDLVHAFGARNGWLTVSAATPAAA